MRMHGHVEGRVLVILIVRRQGVSFGRFISMFMSIQSLLVQKQNSGSEVLARSPYVCTKLFSDQHIFKFPLTACVWFWENSH